MRAKNKWAFWTYDLFPYLLWGKYDKEFKDGTVRVPSYGNAIFRPELKLGDKKGKELARRLGQLSTMRTMLLTALDEHRRNLMKEYK